MRFENLYKLATREDDMNIHKALGILSVLLYFHRLYLLLIYHDMQLNNAYGISTLFIHGILNISSFIFRISNKRHETLTIIYPEFRMHNTLFVFRSIICCICFYYKLHVIVNMLVCFGTMAVADIISNYYKYHPQKLQDATSNTTTMRKMPYMSHLEPDAKKKVIQMHSFMQLVATYYMLENINTAYLPIFAIQISAFLMTLVKKGIIDVASWHYIYSLALWMNIVGILSTNLSYYLEMNLLCGFMYYWRIIYGMNKYAGWLITFAMHYLLKNSVIEYIDTYTGTFDLFYIYLYKYAIILYVLNYYHIKFDKELCFPYTDSGETKIEEVQDEKTVQKWMKQ